MPVLAMAEPVLDHQKRFQAAVDVIHNLPKNGSYQPSYDVMLRFYSLYKQAVCGPCTVSRPGFWDPVGRYKWDAWRRLGEMSRERAMAAYVDEMKNVAQEVIDSIPMTEKTASLFHHFEPLYLVIDDMPRPPESLLTLREDSGVCEGLVLTSDSESEIFCDSVDTVEQLDDITVPVPVKTNGFHNGHESLESSPVRSLQLEGGLEARQVGAGQGGEGAEDGKGPGPNRRSRASGREGSSHNWRERGVPQGGPRWGPPGGGEGAGRGGGDGSEGGADRLQDAQLQQQIMLALRRLRDDMRSVMERLEVVERLAATHAQSSEWRPCLQCSASKEQEEKWWLFDVSGQTVVLFLVWPFVAQGLVYLLRRAQRKGRISS
ncbi:acyl-CoA-binding domain-containing protein 4 isoform X3 [Etheostoma spectabile]|uniref:acyl-CoA-binding domain-containing protein 4 isoform X3 n=1 Tax=Etheostoma spectabile TaxID=54343 RepID=UPI0013AFD037|nr:acyl-CoA-binding domain-containing protein 4-like isoform X3 [Etheostoma spectabile]